MWIENIHSYFYNNPNTIQSQTQSIDKTAGCIKNILVARLLLLIRATTVKKQRKHIIKDLNRMKSIRISKTTILTLLVAAVFASSAYAWGLGDKCDRKCSPDGKQTQGAGMCYRMNIGPGMRINLTDEQKAQLADLQQKFIDETAEPRISLNAAVKNLNILLSTSEPDKKAIKSLIKEIADLKATLMEKRINHELELRKIVPAMGRTNMIGRRCCFNNDYAFNEYDGMCSNMRRLACAPGRCWR